MESPLDTRRSRRRPRFFLFRAPLGSRALVLLLVLLLQIGFQPLVPRVPLLSLAMSLGLILATMFMVGDSRRHLTVGLILGVPGGLGLILGEIQGVGPQTWLAFGFLVLLYLYVLVLMLQKIFRAESVSLDTIGLAMCTYVMLGRLWTLFYIPLAHFDPDAFVFNAGMGGASLSDNLQYFSFVTLTTLGYGDIVPVAPLARSLAVLEALTGVLFLAVLISRLVGAYGQSREPRD